MSLKKRLEKLRGASTRADFIRKNKIPKSTMTGYLSGSRKDIKKMEHTEAIAAANNVTPWWVKKGSIADIRKTEKKDLLRIYELDPEVIDVEIENDKITPVVRTYDNGRSLYFYCIHCGLYHKHGRGGTEDEVPFQKGRGKMAGDRSSHCLADNSPYKINGYILDVVGREKDEPSKRKNRRSAPLCPECLKYYSRAFAACQCGFVNTTLEGARPDLANIYLTRITDEDRLKPTEDIKSEAFTDKPSAKISTSSNFGNDKITELSNVPISYLPEIYAAAGDGIINYDEAKTVMNFDRSFLESQFGAQRFEHLHIIHAIGDSMLNSIAPGDLLFVNPEEKEIQTGAVYVVRVADSIMVKRLEQNPITKEVKLKSDNQAYSPIVIRDDDLKTFEVIGRVIGNFQKL